MIQPDFYQLSTYQITQNDLFFLPTFLQIFLLAFNLPSDPNWFIPTYISPDFSLALRYAILHHGPSTLTSFLALYEYYKIFIRYCALLGTFPWCDLLRCVRMYATNRVYNIVSLIYVSLFYFWHIHTYICIITSISLHTNIQALCDYLPILINVKFIVSDIWSIPIVLILLFSHLLNIYLLLHFFLIGTYIYTSTMKIVWNT